MTGPHQNTGAPPPKAMLGHSAPKRRAKRLVAELRELREMATESKSGSLVFDWGVTSLDTIEGYELTPVIVFSDFLVCFSCETEYVRNYFSVVVQFRARTCVGERTLSAHHPPCTRGAEPCCGYDGHTWFCVSVGV